MKFICEKCGKTFATQCECVTHEKEHQKEEIEKQEKAAKEQSSLENINVLYKAYYDAVKKHNDEFGRKHTYYNPIDFFLNNYCDKSWRT